MKNRYLVFALSFFVLAVLLVAGRLNRSNICAKFPNGLLIAQTALFDPANYLWRPGVALKLPDGSVLIEDEVFWIYFSASSVFGDAERKDHPRGNYKFIFTQQSGLVTDIDDPQLYHGLMEKAGHPLQVSSGGTNMNLRAAFLAMTRDSEYRHDSCPLSILP